MASVDVVVVASVPSAQARRAPHVTFALGTFVVVLPITDPKVDASGFAADWQEVTRPGDVPLLGLRGRNLPRRRLSVTVDEDVIDRDGLNGAGPLGTWDGTNPGRAAEATVAALCDLAANGSAITVSYSSLEAGRWRITDLTYSSTRRAADDNRILRAEMSIELTQASDPPPISRAPAAPPPPPAPTSPAPPPTSPELRRYTVRRGDTLWGIATAVYGNGNLWRRIAEANSIRDPRALPIGKVLTIP